MHDGRGKGTMPPFKGRGSGGSVALKKGAGETDGARGKESDDGGDRPEAASSAGG